MNGSIGQIVTADDLTSGVDAPSQSIGCVREVERREIATEHEKCVYKAIDVEVHPDDLAMRINVIRLGDGGSSNRLIKAEALPPSRADEAQ